MNKEETLQAHVIKLLTAYGNPDACWFAVPNGGLRSIRTAMTLKATGLIPGVADLIVIVSGVCNGVELKDKKGRQSRNQAAWQECFERAGGRYWIAHGLDEALGVLKGIGAFRTGIKFTHWELQK